MIKTRLLPLVALPAVLAVCNSTLAADRAANATSSQEHSQGLSQSIQNQILTLNVNQVSKHVIDFNFSTFHGMYAYREMLLWIQAEPPPQRDELLAIIRSGLEAVVCHSGMGLPIDPGKQAVGLLFGRGLPRYRVLPDPARPATLTWDTTTFEKQIAPESIGQSLAAKSLYVMTTAADDNGGVTETLRISALHEFKTILPLLELAGEKGTRYMPTLLKQEGDKWIVANPSSRLYGQMSLLHGLTHLHAMLMSAAHDGDTIDGKRVADWRKEARLALEKVFHATIRLHLESSSGNLVGRYDPGKGLSDRLAAGEAGYALEVLANMVGVLGKNDPLGHEALNRLIALADYVSAAHSEGKAIAPRSFLVKTGRTYSGLLLLEDQLAIVNGLLAAGQATGREQYDKAARAIFDTAREALWSDPSGVFRAAAGHSVTAYDGRLFGLALAAWRRMEKSLPAGEARRHGDHLVEKVLKQGGLLQAEGPTTGEPKQPETYIQEELPQLVDSLAAAKKQDQAEKLTEAIRALSDQNGDGVPGFRFAGGRFGAAPVIIVQTSVKTPFPPPPADATPARSAP